MTSQPGKQAIAVYILLNISRGKIKQTMKLAQLIECKTEIFFLKNHVQNVVEKLFSDPFLKNQN